MTLLATQFRERLLSRQARVGVVGLGYVGLPFAVEFARSGLTATGIDLDPRKVAAIQRGESYIADVPSADVAALVSAARLRATTDFAVVTKLDAIKLLPLVLAGQPELRDRLNESGSRQLKQRVTLRCEIAPFSQQETGSYIVHRVRTAGGDAARLFTRQAVMMIHERSSGIPRTITVMCDNALLTGFGLGRQPVDSDVVLEVARDFDLGEGTRGSCAM